MATSGTSKECGICNEEFDEEARCPRILHCFHSFCTSCIDQLIINNDRQCPFCRSNFNASSSKDIAVNHLAIELIKYFSVGNSSTIFQKDHVRPRKERIGNLKKETKETSRLHLVNCREAQEQIEKNIKEVLNLQIIIKQENNRIECDVLPKLQDIISQNNRMVEELEKTNKKLQNQLKEVKDKENELEIVKRNIDSTTSNTFSESAAPLDEAEETNTAIGCWIETFKGLISEEERTLHTTEKAIKRTREKVNIFSDIFSSEEEVNEDEIYQIPRIANMAIHQNGSSSVVQTPINLGVIPPKVILQADSMPLPEFIVQADPMPMPCQPAGPPTSIGTQILPHAIPISKSTRAMPCLLRRNHRSYIP